MSEQTEWGDFSSPDDTDGDRPDAEALAVAGQSDSHVSEVIDREDIEVPDRNGTESVELMVTAVDYTVEGYGSDEYPVVNVFGRTEDDELEHVRVVGTEPYFYVPTEDIENRDLIEEYDVILDTREYPHDDESEDRFESIRGEKVTKVVARTPRDVGNIRDDFETTYEADILFPNRFLIDHGITSGLRVEERRLSEPAHGDEPELQVTSDHIESVEVDADLRVNTFDIEVDDRNGFPENGEEPIICLTSHDSYRDEYVLWLYDAPLGDGDVTGLDAFEDYEFISDDSSVDFRRFSEEEAMLDEFLDYLEATDPDVTTGWNFEDFDAPYLFDRMEELDGDTDYDLSPDRASRVGETWRSGWGGPDVKGRVVFDLLYAYQRTQFSELDSYRLDAVAELELGVGKERYRGDIGDLWEDDPARLLEYNLRDVELCVEIDRQQDLIDFWDDTRKFVGCQLEDAPTPGDVVDMYVLHNAYGEFVLPTKGQQEGEDFEGGAVFEPISGVKENVSVLDLKSLYPMCMVTINASPETIVENPEEFDGETYRAPNGTRFRKEPDGMMREMVDELLTEREDLKAARNDHEPGTEAYERFDRQQASIKVIMNSLYGVSGWEQFRLYDKDNAAAITAMGRRVIEFTEEEAAEIGYNITYGDTDSIMLSLSDINTDGVTVPDKVREAHPEMDQSELETLVAALDASEKIEEHINDSYDDFAEEELDAQEHRFQIEFEKLYRRFFQAGKKKRYAGNIVWKEGKHVDDIDITGFEYTRSDIAPITKRVQKRVIEMIVDTSDDEAVIKENLREYLSEVIEQFEEGEIDLTDIGMPGGIGQKLDSYDTRTAQVRGAKYANVLLGTNFGNGSKPMRLYLEQVDPAYFERIETEQPGITDDPDYKEFKRNPDVICFEFEEQVPEEFEVNYEKMLEKTLEGPISRITEALGISWEEVKDGIQQTGLGQYM